MFWAYMLRCADGSYYVGHSDALEQRIGQHQRGEVAGYTQKRRPVLLVWSQDFASRIEALTADQQLKGWSRAKKEALIAGDWDLISTLARKSFDTRLRPSISSRSQPLLRTNGPAGNPCVILVRPQLGENIGKAARAMLNFGLTELRLVAPRDGWPNPSAGPAASGADQVLAAAQVYENVADATADCAHIYATTVRKRGVVKPVLTPEAAVAQIRSAEGRAAILFGPERAGLETDDVAIARTIITVPINPQFGSLNLAQAVMVVAYEWSKTQDLAQPPRVDDEPPAPQEELDRLIGQLDTMLTHAGFYFPPDKVPTVKRNVRGILTKPGWSQQEVRTLRGVLTAIEKPRPKG